MRYVIILSIAATSFTGFSACSNPTRAAESKKSESVTQHPASSGVDIIVEETNNPVIEISEDIKTDKHKGDVNEFDFKLMTFGEKIEYSFINPESATNIAIKEIELLKQSSKPIQKEDLYSGFYDYISVLIAASKENDKALDYLFQHADSASWDDVNFQKDEFLEDNLKNKLSGYFVEAIGRSGNSEARSRLLTLRENINYYGRRDFVDYLGQAFFEQYLVRTMGPEASIEMDFRSPDNRNRVHALKNEMFSLITFYLDNNPDGVEMKKWTKDYYQKQGNVNSE